MCSDPPDGSCRVAWRDCLVYAWSLGCPAFTLGHQGWESGALPGCFWVRSFSLGLKLRPLLRHSPPRSSILYCCQWGSMAGFPKLACVRSRKSFPSPISLRRCTRRCQGGGTTRILFCVVMNPSPQLFAQSFLNRYGDTKALTNCPFP